MRNTKDGAQDWKLATRDYLRSRAFGVKLTSGDILNYFILQTQKKMGFSRGGHMGGRCQILSAFTLWAVLAPPKAPASAGISPSRYQIWGVSCKLEMQDMQAMCLLQRKP